MRLTRAAAQAAQIHVDAPKGDADNEHLTPQKDDRAPLGELTPNSVEGVTEGEDFRKSRQGRSKAKTDGPKGVGDTHSESGEFQAGPNDTSIDRHSPGYEAVALGPGASPAANPVRLTRSQMAMLEAEPRQSSGREVMEAAVEEQNHTVEAAMAAAEDNTAVEGAEEVVTTAATSQDEAQTSIAEDVETPALEVEEPLMVQKHTPAKQFLAKEKLGMRSTSNKENMQPRSPSGTQTISLPQVNGRASATPSRAVIPAVTRTTPLPVRREDPIEAMDALDEAIEEVDRSITHIQPLPSPEKQKKTPTKSATIGTASTVSKTSSRPSARPSTLARSGAVRHPMGPPGSAVNQTASVKRAVARSSSVVRSSPTKAPRITAAKDPSADNPHCKTRPISVSFPTPPPRAKSSKAITKSTFQLPGESIATKLRAAKEERLKKEDEDQIKRREFKARPAPKFNTSVSAAALVKQTAGSRARESMMSGKEVGQTTVQNSGLKRSAGVRDSMVRPKPTAAQQAASKRFSTVPRSTGGLKSSTVGPAGRQSIAAGTATASATNSAAKRVLVISANTSQARVSSSTSADIQQRTASGRTAASTRKGKEVFQRAAAEKGLLDRQKREKEDAAKKARAEASERGRLASREWAERQKAKAKAAAKGKSAAAKGGDGAVGVEKDAGTAVAA